MQVEVQNLTLSPDKSRALARVIFEDPSAVAQYDIVLQKILGDWTVVSVWLGEEKEKPQPPKPAGPPVTDGIPPDRPVTKGMEPDRPGDKAE